MFSSASQTATTTKTKTELQPLMSMHENVKYFLAVFDIQKLSKTLRSLILQFQTTLKNHVN